MKIVTPKDNIPEKYNKSIFLAGPTPREDSVKSWRPDAIKELKKLKYGGIVFVPETDFTKQDYTDQVEWESEALNMADCILFWVPRSKDMPGYTTNVEYGEWMKSGKAVLGFPEDAEKMRYLETKAKDYFIPVSNSIKDTIKSALDLIGDGSLREKGERYIPLHIWNTKSFKNWYADLKAAGNKLEDAKVLWNWRVGKNKEIVFSWILHVNVYITKEKRNKINEFVFSRTDISSVIAYRRAKNILDSEILITKEFRSPVSNKEGFVYELPGGSSQDSSDTVSEVIVKELKEETGLKVNKDRFNYIQSRQVAATLSSHKIHLFSVSLTDDEIVQLKKVEGKTFGVVEDTEMTYVEIYQLKDILKKDIMDWSTIGMILKCLITDKQVSNKEASDWVGSFLSTH